MIDTREHIILDAHLVFNIPVLDKQHANLVRMVNNLRLVCAKGEENADYRFVQAVNEIVDYIHFHIKTEEKLMFLLEFPDCLGHKKKHSDILWEILKRSRQIREGKDGVSGEFVDYLCGAMRPHIEDADGAFADFFVKMERHGKLRLILGASPLLSARLA